MKVESSTSLIPVLDVNTYYSYPVYDDYMFNSETSKESILACAPDIVEERIKEYVPGARISNFSVDMPREYNYGGDILDFDLEIPDDVYQQMYDSALTDPEFEDWLTRYRSSSGFISFMADNIEDFQNQDLMYTVAQLVSYACREYIEKDEYDYEYEEALSDWAVNYVPPCEDELDNGYTIGSDYGYSFTVWDGNEEIAEFEIEGDTNDDYWKAYNKAYEYAMSLTGDT
jgi:hypothetical protein